MATAKPPAFSLGPWLVSPAADEISLDGTVIKLEPRLMGCLLCLAARPGEVVSHQTLLDEVWRDVVVSPDSVYQAVGALRKILGDDSREPAYIANVPRRGYRLIAPVTPVTAPAPPGVDNPVAPPDTTDPTTAVAPRTAARWPLILSIALAAALLTVLAGRISVRMHATEPVAGASSPAVPPGKSIAVLPFVDMSEKKDQEYLADGMAEEILNLLAKTPGLHVSARTSSFYFKGKSDDIPTIGRRLGVANLLEGSVRKSGNQVRITVQLVRSDTGYHVWSETYDRQLSDLFKIQDEISVAVVNALHAALLNASAPTISRASTMDAYLLYLRASASYRLHTPQDNVNAIATLRQCLALDGDYAPAWALLARSLGADYGLFGRGAYAEVSAKMREAAQRAVTLDPKLPDAYLALARSYLLDWRWDEANEAIQKALALEPENSDALSLASFVPEYRGQSDAALRFAEAALIRDPLDFENYNRLADLQMIAGRFGEARAAYRRSYELNPSQDRLHQTLGDLLLASGNPLGALDEYQREPEEMFRLIGRVNALDALGRRVDADTDLAILKERYGKVSPFSIASVYASRKDFDRAFQWLDRAVQLHDGSVAYLRVAPDFKAVRKDPRFEALLREMRLDQ